MGNSGSFPLVMILGPLLCSPPPTDSPEHPSSACLGRGPTEGFVGRQGSMAIISVNH